MILVVALQAASGAFTAELNEPDEPAHFVTALMIREYILSAAGSNPLAFAEDYYLHYPKVAFGHWPPAFHLLSGMWMLLFSASRASILLLLAAITAATATAIYRTARAEWSAAAAIALSAAFVLLPLTQYLTQHVLADTMVAALDFWAMCLWARFMDEHRTRDAVAFGVVGALAMLTKGNAIALLALPFVSVVLCWELGFVRNRAFWYGPILMVALGAPSQLITWRLINGAVSPGGSMIGRIPRYGVLLARDPGPLVLSLAGIGAIAAAAKFHTGSRRQHLWMTAIALVVAVIAFHIAAPIDPDIRYLFGAIPPLILLAGKGIEALLPKKPAARRANLARLGLLALLCTAFLPGTFRLVRKARYGFAEIARALVSTASDRVILTSSSSGDGMLIAEIAMLENRPSRYVLRANKVLSTSTWDAYHYELRYRDTKAMSAYLASVPVDTVVVDEETAEVDRAHHELLQRTLREYHQDWNEVGTYEVIGRNARVRVFRTSHPPPPDAERRIQIDMKYSLGRTIGNR